MHRFSIQKKEDLGVGRAIGKIKDPKHQEFQGLISAHSSRFLFSHRGLASWACDAQDLVFGLMLYCCHSEILNFIIDLLFVGKFQ